MGAKRSAHVRKEKENKRRKRNKKNRKEKKKNCIRARRPIKWDDATRKIKIIRPQTCASLKLIFSESFCRGPSSASHYHQFED